jgi:hypothetical protein
MYSSRQKGMCWFYLPLFLSGLITAYPNPKPNNKVMNPAK